MVLALHSSRLKVALQLMKNIVDHKYSHQGVRLVMKVAISEFKAKCTQFLRAVEEGGDTR